MLQKLLCILLFLQTIVCLTADNTQSNPNILPLLLNQIEQDIFALLDKEEEIPYTVYTFQENRITLPEKVNDRLNTLIIKQSAKLLIHEIKSLENDLKQIDLTELKKQEQKQNQKKEQEQKKAEESRRLIMQQFSTKQNKPASNSKNKQNQSKPLSFDQLIKHAQANLMKKYNVRTEPNLKQKLLTECKNHDYLYIKDDIKVQEKIVDWVYTVNTDTLEFYPDGYISSTSSSSSSSSSSQTESSGSFTSFSISQEEEEEEEEEAPSSLSHEIIDIV